MIELKCDYCGFVFKDYYCHIKRQKHHYCSTKCVKKARESNGVLKRKDGYISVRAPGHPRANQWGYVYAHILAAEKHFNRPVLKSDVIHHIDGNPSNNSLDNLKIFNNDSEHLAEHARERIIKAGGNPDTQKICCHCKKMILKTMFSPSSSRGKKTLSSTCKKCCAIKQDQRRKRLLVEVKQI